MILSNHEFCNNYSIFINMKISQKNLDQFQEFLFDLLKTSKVIINVKLAIFYSQMLIKVIHTFICQFGMCIISQYIGYMNNIEF
jgi:hypothetical protein